MIYENNSKFQQWLLDNHNKTVDDLTWEEYNKYNVIYSNQTFFERMIRPNEELV